MQKQLAESRQIRKREQIRLTDFKSMRDGTTVIVGVDGSGKSVIIDEVLDQTSDNYYDIIVGMYGSSDTAASARKRFPASLVYEGWHPQRFKEIVNKMESLSREGKKMLIILDDLTPSTHKKSMFQNQDFVRVLMNSRFMGITMIVSVQHVRDLSLECRMQATWVILTAQKSSKSKKFIYDTFNPCFRSFQKFEEVMRACTTDHRVMVMDMMPSSDESIGGCISCIKAKYKRYVNSPFIKSKL